MPSLSFGHDQEMFDLYEVVEFGCLVPGKSAISRLAHPTSPHNHDSLDQNVASATAKWYFACSGSPRASQKGGGRVACQ